MLGQKERGLCLTTIILVSNVGQTGTSGNSRRQSYKLLSKSELYLTPLTNCLPFPQHPC